MLGQAEGLTRIDVEVDAARESSVLSILGSAERDQRDGLHLLLLATDANAVDVLVSLLHGEGAVEAVFVVEVGTDALVGRQRVGERCPRVLAGLYAAEVMPTAVGHSALGARWAASLRLLGG